MLDCDWSSDVCSSDLPWRLPPVDEDLSPRFELLPEPEPDAGEEMTAAEIERLPMLTADEIEAVQKQAHDEAFTQGWEEGRKQGYDDGYRQGREQGHSEGYAEGQAEIKQLSERFEQILKTLDQPLEELDACVEQELTTLAIAVARQLIRRELRTDPGQIVAVVREAMALLPSSARKISLHLHPDDAGLVRHALSLDDDGEQSWKIVEDPLLTRGGCKITSATSSIDARVEKRLNAVIAKAFGGERGGDAE
jgi:flagellar assembly protein FliH